MSGAVPPPAARPLERAARVPVCVCVRVRALLGRVGRAGLPGAFWCASPFPLAALSFCFAWPPRAGVAPLSLAAAPFPRCPGALFFFFFFFFFFSSPPAAWLVGVSRLAVGCSLVVAPPPPSPCVSRGFCRSRLVPGCCFFFFFFFVCFFFLYSFLCAPPLSPAFSGFRPRLPWASALALFALLVCRFSALRALVPLSCFPPGCWLLPRGCCPPPPLVSLGSRRRRSVLRAVLCCAWLGAALRRAAARCVARWCAVLCCVALVWCRCFLRRALWRCPSPWGPVLCCAVFCGVPSRCVLCAVCVLSWRGGACCCSPLCFVLCVSRGAVLCVPCALRSARCCASLCWCARVVLFEWCVPLLALWCAAVCFAVSCGVPWCGAGSVGPWLFAGGVFRCRCPCLAAWSASLWLVWFAVVPCFPVSCSVVLCCRVVLCCCSLLSFCGAVGACFALLWAVALCCVVLLVGCAVFCPVVVSARCGALSLVPWCRAAAWCRGVLSCRLVGFVSCVGVVVPTCKTAA